MRLLILGGAGMVGIQVAREAVTGLAATEIVISALTQREVDEAVSVLETEANQKGWDVKFTSAPGDIFLPEALQGVGRDDLIRNRASFDALFESIFEPLSDAWKDSALNQLISRHQPDVIVDCINTATAISYQDAFTISRKVKMLSDRAEDAGTVSGEELRELVQSVHELLVAQGVPQIVRHILTLHRSLRESSVRTYVKVGTTGTGGMGINIPYTHSEDKPSPKLLSKSAIGFAHTGLLFLLARTPASTDSERTIEPAGTIIKEIKPGAMIGFRSLGVSHVKIAGADGRRTPGYLIKPRSTVLGDAIEPIESMEQYERFEGRDVPLRMVGADTGENGFFSIGEFQAITYPRQMEYVTPEEVARTIVVEILGASTGRDVLSAIDGAITEPSYRAGVLRWHACAEMERLEKLLAHDDEVLPSIAVGHLGPPRLTKLLIEAYLLRVACGTSSLESMIAIEPAEMRSLVVRWLEENPRVASLIATIGIPVLEESDGVLSITRGPRLNIPAPNPDGEPIALDGSNVEQYAWSGWVDLRLPNFVTWYERIVRVSNGRPDIAGHGSAAFDRSRYIPAEFIPGDLVGWLLTNEVDDLGMVGRRMF